MTFKFWRWTFLQWAKMYIVLAIFTFIGFTIYFYISLQQKGPDWLFELGFFLLMGFTASIIFLFPAGIMYFLHLIFKDTLIQDTTVFKAIWKKCNKKEKRKFQLVWILGVLYVGITLSPIPLIMILADRPNWVGIIFSFIGFILLLCGIPTVRSKVTKSLSFFQEKQGELSPLN